jgi:hypothetical protein
MEDQVTQVILKELRGLDAKIDGLSARLDSKIDRVHEDLLGRFDQLHAVTEFTHDRLSAKLDALQLELVTSRRKRR